MIFINDKQSAVIALTVLKRVSAWNRMGNGRPRMTMNVVLVMMTLHQDEEDRGLSMSDIVELCGFTPASASGLVETLVDKFRWVDRFDCPNDRREVRVRLNLAGKAEFPKTGFVFIEPAPVVQSGAGSPK